MNSAQIICPPKPDALPVHPENIPDELKQLRQWVAWTYRLSGNQWKKLPVSYVAPRGASTTDSATWTTFERAWAHYQNAAISGIGFVFSANDPYLGVDLDHCRDPQTGIIETHAQEIIDALSGYTEVSASGSGIHIIVRGKLPSGGNRTERVEMYDRDRYFTMTGEVLL